MSLRYDGKKPVVDCSKDKGFTVQADREDADINKIIQRFEKSGQQARVNSKEPFYGDVSDIGDLAESLMKVQKAQELFMEYEWPIRERFDNDPSKFVEFLEDEGNRKEAEELGIVQKRPVEPSPSPVPEPGK